MANYTYKLRFTLSDGSTIDAGEFVAPQGPQGIQGVQGPQGDTGPKGDTGAQGPKGDKGETGAQGIQGVKGDPFAIVKIYDSVEAMNADYSGTDVAVGQFVLVDTGNVEDPDNAKLYVKGNSAYTFLTDMSGSQGIQGPQGIQGIQGVKGDTGAKGDTGPQGPKGDKGATGDTGAQGVGVVSATVTLVE